MSTAEAETRDQGEDVAAHLLPRLTPTQLGTMSTSLRLACMRVSRRVRFESSHDLAPSQFSVLSRLEDGPSTPGELAEAERVAKPSMSRTVAGLVERGLVERADDPSDRRSVILTITPDGLATIKAIRRKRDAWMVTRVGALPRAEQEVLREATAILMKVANSR